MLKDYVLCIVAPAEYREQIEPHIPENLAAKVHFLENDCKDIWEWSEKVYEFAREIV